MPGRQVGKGSLLRAHLTEHGTTPDGRLFRGVRGGELAESTYCRVWRKARVQALTAAEAASRWPAGPMTCDTPPCRRGSTPGRPPPRSPHGPGNSLAVL
jgi:hypothetical protein